MSQVLPLNQNDNLVFNPHHLEAEQAVLGGLLVHNAVLESIGDFLRAEHFFDPLHQKIYQLIVRFVGRGQVADPVTLRDSLLSDETLVHANPYEYLKDLASNALAISQITDYAHIVYDLFLRRQLINIGHTMLQEVRKSEPDADTVNYIEDVERKLYDLATQGDAQKGLIGFASAATDALNRLDAAMRRDNHLVGVTTGLIDLDKTLGGLHPSDLIILAGRPSMGKTSLATNIAFNAANATQGGGPVAFFSLEMSSEQLASRILSAEAGVVSDRIRRGDISEDEYHHIMMVSAQLNSLPLFIDDTPGINLSTIRNRARRLKRQHGLELIIIDYLQLIDGKSSQGRSGENRVQEISEITRGLKGLAKELNVPVIALSQLSRAVEQREDKRPQLSDLRESGSIEQDADVVMFVFREAYYEVRRQPNDTDSAKFQEWQKRMNACANRGDVIIAKQRHGPVGSVALFFDERLTKFGNLDLKHTSYN